MYIYIGCLCCKGVSNIEKIMYKTRHSILTNSWYVFPLLKVVRESRYTLDFVGVVCTRQLLVVPKPFLTLKKGILMNSAVVVSGIFWILWVCLTF